MKNLTGKDKSKFYEMDENDVRTKVKQAQAYEFIPCGPLCWEVKYYKKKHGYARSAATGYLYVLQNTSFPGMFKVGFTERNVADRLREINDNAGMMTPWQVRDFWFCDKPYLIEQEVHRRLEPFRVESNKEGFQIDYMTIRKVAFEVLGIADDSEDDSYW